MAKENNILKYKVVHGLAWKFAELAGAQGIQFVVAIILARLMTPEEYGTIGLIMIFITIANVFVQSGFATALIQNKAVNSEDFSSVFWISIMLATVVYIMLFFAAPTISVYYDTEILIPLLRITGIILFPGAVISIQVAYVSRNMDFKKLFASTIVAVVISGIVAVTMAYMGVGVWAMSAQQIIYNIVLMLVLFITVKWKPKIILNQYRIKVLFNFGWKILLSGLIDTIWMNVYGLVIGKRFSQTELGGYNRGEQFPKLIAYNLSSSLQSVMLPAFSSIQHDKIKLKDMMKQSIRISSFFVFPMMAGLIAVSEPLVSLLLTDKWLFCVPYMRIMCISYAVWPIHVTNLQVMNAMGRSDIFLKLELIKKLIGIVVLIFSLRYGIIIMLSLKVLNEIFCTFVNVYPNKKLINYGIAEQYMDMLAPICVSVVMGFITISVIKLNLGSAESLFIQLLVGSIVYILLSWMVNRKTFNTIFNIIKKPSAD